jgi:hypothetical protein
LASTSYYNSQKDPFDSDNIPRLLDIRSATKGGGSTTFLGVADLTVPTSPNYPSTTNGTANRYFLYLPYNLYRTSTNTTSFVVTNETQSKSITIIEPGATLTDYTCKLSPFNSDILNVIEVHVGSTSNQAGDTLSYQGKAVGSGLNSTNIDNLKLSTLQASSISVTNGVESSTFTSSNVDIKNQFKSFRYGLDYISTSASTSVESVFFKIYELGIWDMNNTISLTLNTSSVSVPYNFNIMIQDDSRTQLYSLTSPYQAGIPNARIFFTKGSMTIDLNTSSTFSLGSQFNSTSINRGWLSGFFRLQAFGTTTI